MMRELLGCVATSGGLLGVSGGGATLASGRPGSGRYEGRPSIPPLIAEGVTALKNFAESCECQRQVRRSSHA